MPNNEQELEKMAAKLAFAIAKEAKRRAPVETGRLRNSIKVKRTSEGWEISVGVDYAAYVEYMKESVRAPQTTWPAKQTGPRNPDATMPFFRPAIYTTLRKFERGEL